jgi:hypothetical protein
VTAVVCGLNKAVAPSFLVKCRLPHDVNFVAAAAAHVAFQDLRDRLLSSAAAAVSGLAFEAGVQQILLFMKCC